MDDLIITCSRTVFQAVNATTGEIVYTMNLGTTAKGGPITFLNDGQQMVVQAVGGTPGFGYEAYRLEFGSFVVGFSQ